MFSCTSKPAILAFGYVLAILIISDLVWILARNDIIAFESLVPSDDKVKSQNVEYHNAGVVQTKFSGMILPEMTKIVEISKPDEVVVEPVNPSKLVSKQITSSINFNHNSCPTLHSRLLPVETQECPDSYIYFDRYGDSGMNNALRQVVASLLIAGNTKRTLILADGFGFDWQSFDFGDLCVLQMSRINIERLKNEKSLLEYKVDLPLQFGKHFTMDIECVASTLSDKITEDNSIVHITNPFFTSISKANYVNVLGQMQFNSQIRRIGDQFISKSFGADEYVGLHLRNFQGECVGQLRNVFIRGLKPYLSDALMTCEMPWEYISQILQQHGYDPSTTKILLSSDGERKYITDMLMAHENVIKYDRKFRGGPQIDMYLLSRSSLFIGNPYSSLSFHVALWREGLYGYGADTNVLPGYNEAGYIHHLFLPA